MSVLDFILLLATNSEYNTCGDVASLLSFFYNIKSSQVHIEWDEVPISPGKVSPVINAQALADGYYTASEIGSVLCRPLPDELNAIGTDDFGITALLMLFANYCSHNRYLNFVYDMHSVRELELLERILIQSNKIKLPYDFATHSQYGLSSGYIDMLGTDYITVMQFSELVGEMMLSTTSLPQFMKKISRYHKRIIESICMFNSLSIKPAIIKEAREITAGNGYRRLKHTFKRPQQRLSLDGCTYWMYLPKGSVWFAHQDGRVCTNNSYIGRDDTHKIANFLKPPRVPSGVRTIGFLTPHERLICPVEFLNFPGSTNWKHAQLFMNIHGMNSPWKDITQQVPHETDFNYKHCKLYFVCENIPTVFMLKKDIRDIF